MSTLHTVNKSPYERVAAASAFSHLSEGDAVLLIEDGVLGARKGGSFERRIGEAHGVAVYALKPDLDARGLKPEQLDEQTFSRFLLTADMPDPDLLIRTSGEKRISNFLLWQCAYAEFVFLERQWPDFDQNDFNAAIQEYLGRTRRYGGAG